MLWNKLSNEVILDKTEIHTSIINSASERQISSYENEQCKEEWINLGHE